MGFRVTRGDAETPRKPAEDLCRIPERRDRTVHTGAFRATGAPVCRAGRGPKPAPDAHLPRPGPSSKPDSSRNHRPARREDEVVALLFEHDAPVIAAMLGVLKAGKIYLPLDPSYPPARLTALLDDAGAGLIVTDSNDLALAEELAQQAIRVLNLEELDSAITAENPSASLAPDTLAYILFTSGSTGRPKGVCHTHRNVLHRVSGDTNIFRLCPEDRISLLSFLRVQRLRGRHLRRVPKRRRGLSV